MISDGQYSYCISNSELRDWKRCRRRWWLTWYRKLTPRLTDHSSKLASGTRVHAALAEWYKPNPTVSTNLLATLSQLIDAERTEITREVLELCGDDASPDDYAILVEDNTLNNMLNEYDKVTSVERAMVEGYLQWLEETGADQQYEAVASELPIVAPFATIKHSDVPIRIYAVGIIDAQIRDRETGELHFIDHKTVDSLAHPLPTLRLDEQMLHYILLLQLHRGLHPAVDGLHPLPTAFYNMLRRVKRTPAAKPPFFARHRVHHNQLEIRRYSDHLLGATLDIITTSGALAKSTDAHHQVAYPSPTRDCAWDCPFFTICPMFDDGSRVEEAIEARYKTRNPLERYTEAFKRHQTTTNKE